MTAPTTAEASVTIEAPPDEVYDLLSDLTRMGEWSPECTGGEWIGEPGVVGSRFRGHNRRGLARWSTTAEVVVADRPRTFTFATIYRNEPSTRWSYELTGDGPTTVTESFEAVHVPALIAFVERLFLHDRQEQLEAGMADTLRAVKAVAEAT